MKHHPPKNALSFLRWFCRKDYLEEVEGNLVEMFEEEYPKHPGRANRQFCWQVLLHFRPEYIRPMEGTYRLNYYGMFKNFVKVGIRNIARDKAYTAINILGLALGILCCFFILLWVHDERSMDNFHENGDELYHVYHTCTVEGETSGDYNTQLKRVDNRWIAPIKGIAQAIPEVKYVGLYATGYELPWGHPETFQIGDKIF
ncbi:MAG: permease prefix domain 2-containing transporter, partial [Bacteroidota bacterium]